MILALKNLWRRPTRTLLSILGVGVGVASIVAFTSIALGILEGINEYARETGSQLLAYDRSVSDPAWSRLKAEDVAALRAMPNVQDVASSSGIPAARFGKPAILVLGRYPKERFMSFYGAHLLEGRILQKEDEAMLGSVAAKVSKKKVGDKVEVLGSTFTVVGVFRTKVMFENGATVVHLNVVSRFLHPGQVGMAAFLYLKDPKHPEETAREIERRLPRFRVVSTAEIVKQFEQADYLEWFVWAISVAALAVGIILVLNTLLISVSERVREIGTLRAFGWTRARILALIWMEGVLISSWGGLAGIGLGVGGAELLTSFIPEGYLETSYQAWTFVKAMAVAIGMGLLGSFIPAYRASHLAPAEALRYE